MEVKLLAFLFIILEPNDWLNSRYSHFIPRERIYVDYAEAMLGCRASLDAMASRKIRFNAGNRTLHLQLLVSLRSEVESGS
jgi:hypothetical protein